jgi:hypothetical protein
VRVAVRVVCCPEEVEAGLAATDRLVEIRCAASPIDVDWLAA